MLEIPEPPKPNAWVELTLYLAMLGAVLLGFIQRMRRIDRTERRFRDATARFRGPGEPKGEKAPRTRRRNRPKWRK